MSSASVLVVDDDALTAHLIAEVLEDAGFGVMVATSGGAALASLSADDVPDVAVIDQHLPGLDGHDLIRAVLEHESLGAVRVLAVSGDPLALERAGNLGVPVLAKPFNLVRLIDEVRDLACAAGEARAAATPEGRSDIGAVPLPEAPPIQG